MRPSIRAWALGLLLFALPAGAASLPPELRFRALVLKHLTLYFHQGLEPMARQAAPLAEEILASHEARYGTRLPRVHVLLSDQSDSPNGLTSPLPYPFVKLLAAAPSGNEDFGNLEGWLRLVLTHELAHAVHLNEARGLPRFGRKLFGRAPFLFPNLLTPTWLIEGLATFEETEGTAFGRGRSADGRMVLRMAALEGRSPGEDRPVLGWDDWPGGEAPYLFGESYLRDLHERFGQETLPALARKHSGRIVPFLDEWTVKSVTGAGLHARWREWQRRQREAAGQEQARVEGRGLTATRALTTRGIEQRGPRFSPDGTLVAYTSVTLERFPAIRLVGPDGGGDRRLVDRNGGRGLSFTPDGRSLVYDEPEVEKLFALRGGLRAVDVRSGRARWIARGVRASDPDVAPDGRRIAYVERLADRSELALVGLDGRGRRLLTRSAEQSEWSGPRFSPDGLTLVASRWLPGGWLDLLLVDAESGAVRELTHDRARDLEPCFTPDGRAVVFRSDRDGVSNLYALRLDEPGRLLRLTNVLGGAFDPAVAPDGRRLAFAGYSARGYDLQLAELQLEPAPAAEPFVDAYPPARELPAPTDLPARGYNPLPMLWPRFYVPYAASIDGQWRVGAASGGFDVLFRHAWGLELHRGLDTERWGARGFYQYDRFRPTFLLTAEDVTDPGGQLGRLRTQDLTVRASLPLQRSLRFAHSLGLAWRFERQSQLDAPGARPFDLGGLELSWAFSSAKLYPYSISPTDGWRARLAWLREDPAFGSDVFLSKLYGEVRAYPRLFGAGDVLAVSGGGGTTVGRPGFQRSYSVGGFPAGGLFDVVGTNFAVLRGYPDDVESGRSFAHASLEYRLPLWRPERGWSTFPAFLRHLHAAAFLDGAHAWSGPFEWSDVKLGAGAALGTDAVLGHGLPFTATAGVGHGFQRGGDTRAYFRLGLSF